MVKKKEFIYYTSSLIEDMLFDSKEDALEFDTCLVRYIKNPKAIAEFKSAPYASLAAVQYAINNDTLVHSLKGEYTEELIELAERMVDGDNGATYEDCYKLTFNFIFNKIYNL